MFNFCVHEKYTRQIWQLEQGNSIAWHKARRVFPVVFWEGAKQMCSNIYKCTIFSCSSAARPADFARSRLRCVLRYWNYRQWVSPLKEWLRQGPPASSPCIQRAKWASRWQGDRALSNTQLPGFTLPHKVHGIHNHQG